MVSTPDSESGNPSSNLGETSSFFFIFLGISVDFKNLLGTLFHFKGEWFGYLWYFEIIFKDFENGGADKVSLIAKILSIRLEKKNL